MPRPNYPVSKYIKAVEILLKKKGFERVVYYNKSGSIVHFDLFRPDETIPHVMWQIHHEHNKKKTIWSKEDYKKAARGLCASLEEFLKVLEET